MKKLTNKELRDMLIAKYKTYYYFYQLKELDYLKRMEWFTRQIDELEDLDPNAVQEDHYYNQNWKSSVKIPKKGA